MSSYQTSSFGMEHNALNEDIKLAFDEQFASIGDGLETGVWSIGCTGSCLCSLSCSDCSCGCS